MPADDVATVKQAFAAFASRDLVRLEDLSSASLVVLVSLFLPWFGISGLGANISVSGTTAHGYFLLVVILVVLMCAYLLLRSGWEEFPVSLPVRHLPHILIGGVELASIERGREGDIVVSVPLCELHSQ